MNLSSTLSGCGKSTTEQATRSPVSSTPEFSTHRLFSPLAAHPDQRGLRPRTTCGPGPSAAHRRPDQGSRDMIEGLVARERDPASPRVAASHLLSTRQSCRFMAEYPCIKPSRGWGAD